MPDTNKPQTVLMLHAYPLSAAMWAKQKQALEAAGLKVLAPNLPGFGGADGAINSLKETAADLIKTLPDEAVAVVGLSMGGYLALELLAQAPERFTRVVLADTTCRADDPDKKKDRAEQAERVEKEGGEFIVEAAEKEHSPATFRQVKPMIEAASRAGIAGALRAMAARPDHCATLEKLSVPLLVLVGENDQITPQSKAQEMAEKGRGELKTIPDAAHLSNLDNPEAFNAALLAFLN